MSTTNGREFVQLRRLLFDHLDGQTFARVNMTAMAKATAKLTEDGWTAEDIASQILGDWGDYDPAALVISRTRALDGQPAPRPVTPAPPAYDREAHAKAMHASSPNPSGWVARIRGGLR